MKHKFITKNICKLMLISICLILISCKYSGEGEYSTKGFWPFKSYRLSLPIRQIYDSKPLSYDIRGFKSHSRSWLYVSFGHPDINIEELVQKGFYEIDLEISIRKSDKNVILSKKNRLENYKGVLDEKWYFLQRVEIPSDVSSITIIAKNIPKGIKSLTIEVK